jgi:GNAT superfamily N-acetyltransferase
MARRIEHHRIRTARPEEIGRVREIEDEAGKRFTGLGLIDEALDVSFPWDELSRLIRAGQVWVACETGDRPVGMVIASVRDDAVYVEEMDVLPEHGRRGLGSALLGRVCEWAQQQGYPAVTLSTFRDVPWNGPFYRRLGFRDLDPAEWSPGMPAIRDAEARDGLRIEERVFMRRDLPAADDGHPEKRRDARMQVRVARQSGRLDAVVAFYRDGLGLPEIDRFAGHAGYDGVMLDLPGTGTHLEFTATAHTPPPDPHVEDLLVLYVGDRAAVDRILERLDVTPVASANPYWDGVGVTVVDPDGFRVVLVADTWSR